MDGEMKSKRERELESLAAQLVVDNSLLRGAIKSQLRMLKRLASDLKAVNNIHKRPPFSLN